jgi:hypothetical protein
MSERKEWYRAAQAYRVDNSHNRTSGFLKEHGASYGLNPPRDGFQLQFAVWVLGCCTEWSVGAKLYREGNFASRNAFFQKYEFLFKQVAFSRREKIFKFALMFYDEEADFRHCATNSELAIELMRQASLANNHSDGEVRVEGEDGDDDEQKADSLEDDENDSDGEFRDEGEDDGDDDDEYEQEADSLEDENDEPNKEEPMENYGAKAAETFAWMTKAFWSILGILMLVQLARIESILWTMVQVWQSVDSSDL